ncbi:GNAT family N-acetyltransferase [Butyrivibrio fibrisolvens]|uniref:GNAT family N-acetyltransferase n=1 Tax=Butyrivibrio fibrisolvens TaxID=831 RepID=UPI00041E3853|nr:GNAT family protein [Butyrivibrio fibrisolvens]
MYRLRELERKDLSEINKWRNDIEVINCLGAPFRYISYEVDEKWFNAYMHNRNNCVRCAIVDESNDNIVGVVSLTNIDFIRRSAIFHIMIGKRENRGKGIGSFATKEMLHHAFENMNLNRVELEALSNNTIAINMYKKSGFVEEGIKRQAVYKNGNYIDMTMLSVLKHEYLRDLQE